MKQLISIYKKSFSNLQRNVWILAFSMFINRTGAMVLLFTSLYLTNDLHFSIADAGLVMSFYGIGSVLGSYFGGWLTDRMHFYKILIFSLLASGTVLLLMLWVRTPIGVSIVIFIYAFVSDIFRPANSKAIAAFSDKENLTRSVSLVRLAMNLGFSVGPAIGGFVALYLGYHWLFILDAITSISAAILLAKYLPKPETINNSKEKSIKVVKSKSAYSDLRYLVFILLTAFFGLTFFQLFASVPQYFSVVCKYSEDTIGLLIALNGFLIVLIEMPLVAYLEKKKQGFKYIIIGVFLVPLAFLILLFGNGLMIMALIYTFVLTMAEIFAMPFMMNYALSRPNEDRQGQYSALYSIAYGLANIGAPIVGLGIASAYGFNNMFVVIIIISSLSGLGFWLLRRTGKSI